MHLRAASKWWNLGFTAEWWDTLSFQERTVVLDTMTDREIEEWFRDWRVWARDDQLAPAPGDHHGDWRRWLICAGRGWGKTRTCVEYILEAIEAGWAKRIAIVGQGEDDIRTVMVEGESGFINCSPSWNKPVFKPSVGGGRLIWPNGAVAFLYSAEDSEALRGPQFHLGWFDEPMAVPAEKRERSWSNLRFCLRLGHNPKLLVSTTPKKHRWMKKQLVDAEDWEKNKIHVTRGSTFDNSKNLAPSFLEDVAQEYDGTRLGRQELYGELLGDEEGALWTTETLDQHRMSRAKAAEVALTCDKVVVAVDPNIKKDGTAHAAGVIVLGKRAKHRYVLADRSTKGGPLTWAKAAVLAFDEFKADEIVAEANQGGEMVKITILQAADELGIDVKVHLVYASRGKVRRAEPAAASYERGLVHHVGPAEDFDKVETQMTAIHDGYDPTGEDFDRADAVVWGLTRLGLKKSSSGQRALVGFASMSSFGDPNA